jgi:hypothetical protein
MQISNGTKNKVASILSSGQNIAGNLQPKPHELEFVAVSTRLLGSIYLLLVNSRTSQLQERQSKYNNLESERLEKDRRNDEIIKALSVKFKPIKKIFKTPGKPAEPGKAPEVKPTTPTKPAEPGKAPEVKPTTPTKPAEPGKAPEVKPTTPTKPEVKPTTPTKPAEPGKAPEVKPEIKPEVKPTTPTKPEVKPEIKPEVKPTTPTKPEVKPEVKPEIKPEVKPTAKPEIKPTKTAEVKPTKSAEPVKSPEVSPSKTAEPIKAPSPSKAIGGAIAAGGIVISGVALASMKHEQGVKSVEDALNKSGNITPDVERDGYKSTSYGLFGINNINAKDKKGNFIKNSSSIASFVKSHPELKLPEPGGHNEPDQKKLFDSAWKNLGSSQPEKLLNAQLQWFKTNFEDAAKEKLTKGGISENITSDPSVQKYMIDRKIQFGYAMYDSAINYAKNAKTPNEFMDLVSEHDLKNLRQIFSKTPDEEFEKLRKGLVKRIENRKKEALNLGAPSSSENNKSTPPTPLKPKSRSLKTSDVGTDTIIMANVNENTSDQNTDQKTYSTVENTQKQINLLNNNANVENINDKAIYFQKQLEYQRGFA